MLEKCSKHLAALACACALAVCFGMPVMAQNPATGDSSGTMMVVMGALLAVSVVLVIVYVILSAKKKKR